MVRFMNGIEFVFVHSYSSRSHNWMDVMVGTGDKPGRLLRALALASASGVKVLADDKYDKENMRLLDEFRIENLKTARRTRDEAQSALNHSATGSVLFVTSPDHLPRVVRDVLALGGTKALFTSSEVPFSRTGPASVIVREPPSKNHRLFPQLLS